MARNISHRYIYSYSYVIKLFRTADLCYRLRHTSASVEYYRFYSQSAQRPDKESDVPTVSEVRKRFRKIMGVKPGVNLETENRSYLLQYLPETQEELPPRTVKDSIRSAIIPISSNVKLQERYINVLGHVRMGRIMEDMDMFAAWVALNFVDNPKQPKDVPASPYIMTTVLVDHVTFTDYITRGDIDIHMSGRVSSVGRTSIEVSVWLGQVREGMYHEITTAIFLMAARNANLSAGAIVNRLIPKNEEEKIIVDQGQVRMRQRIALDKESILTAEPLPEEQHIIHKLFLESIDTTLTRRVLPPGAIWMADTMKTNNIFSFTEDRNFQNTVFGGFLMRHALEMAWFTSYFHSKHRPRLISISDIHFKKPVTLGSIICFHGQVTYTERNFMQIFVHGDVTNPFHAKPVTSLVFNFTYESPEVISCVKPNTYYEAMMYIDGRRHLSKVLNMINKKG